MPDRTEGPPATKRPARRFTVTLPEELYNAARALPDFKPAAVMQAAIRTLLAAGCQHEELTCQRCENALDRWALEDDVRRRFYLDALAALEGPVGEGATAEGAARVLKQLALQHRVPKIEEFPLPRPTRSQRAWNDHRAEEKTRGEVVVRELRYEDVIADLVHVDDVSAWLRLGQILDRRKGWAFRIIDGMPYWIHHGRHLSATAEARGRRLPEFTLSRPVRPEEMARFVDQERLGEMFDLEELVDLPPAAHALALERAMEQCRELGWDHDMAVDWTYDVDLRARGALFLAAVARLEQGKLPAQRPALTGPWIEERWWLADDQSSASGSV